MRNQNLFATVFCFIGIFTMCLTQATSAPQTSKVEYTDYLPKYRTLSEGFLLSKIEYTSEDMIVFFRYVAGKDNDLVTFHGAQTEFAWKLTTSTRSQASNAYSVTRLANVENIRVNDESKMEYLDGHDKKEYLAKKGDIITCEIRFKSMPRTVRTAHLLGGDVDRQGTFRFNCNDILLKSKESSLLGTKDQMDAAIKRFYSKQRFVNYPDIKDATTSVQDQQFKEKKAEVPKPRVNALEKALEPIDYMPKQLASIDDMECNERVILKNVYFHDNKAEFAGRVRAMKTINLIVDYMNFYPKAKIVLHGHTDIFGNSFRNLELSKNRVMTVKRVIASKGIDPARIITIHHGGSQPLQRYKDGGELNRRVEAEVLCSGVAGSSAIKSKPSANN